MTISHFQLSGLLGKVWAWFTFSFTWRIGVAFVPHSTVFRPQPANCGMWISSATPGGPPRNLTSG